jgi:tetratricopeptide (TPR) repeat protein
MTPFVSFTKAYGRSKLKGGWLSCKSIALINSFSMAERTSREIAEDHYYHALDLYADGRHEEAVAAYRQSIEADPSHTEAMHGLARVYQDMGRYDDAIDTAKRIAELDKDDVLAHTSLSILYQKKNMIPEAEEEANKARILGWKQQLRKK